MSVDKETLLTLEEVAVLIGSSHKSINNWYWFKRENPTNEYARMLPDYIQVGKRQTRYWRKSDVWKLIEFKQRVPKGRSGIMGSITQRYYKKEKQDEKNTDTD